MEDFKKVLDELQKSVKSLQDQMTYLKSGEVLSGVKTPGERSPLVQQVGDEVPTWAERMELKTETLTSSGDEIRPVKVREETELVLQKAFAPLKNQDHRALRHQFLVPDMPLTMAPKLDKVMAAECIPAVRTSDQSLARLQALMLDTVGPLTDLRERISRSVSSEGQEDEEDQGLDLQVVEDSVQSALAFLGNAATQFSAYRRTKILEEYNKDLVSFSEEVEPDLRAAAPLLFGQSFTKQAADHLGQVEALRKVKGKGKRFFQGPPAKAGPVAGGEQAIPSKLWTERDFRPEHAQEANEMTINFSRAEGSDCRRAKGSCICNAVNTKCVNCQSYNGKMHALGFTQVQRPVNNPQVAGRISHFAINWKTITEDQWVLRTVQGFLIPFREEPHQVHAPQPCRFSEDQMKLLREEVSSLLGKGAVVTVEPAASEEGFYSTLFLVPKTEGQMRPIINLKALNFWVHPQHFKMEGIHMLREIVAQDEWLAKLDLKDAYFTVPINRDHWKFLRFMVDQVRYQFTCLQFGLSCAPWAFTKVLKPVSAFLRSVGVRLIIYIDDILVIGKTPDEVRNHVEALIALLEGLGFIVNMEKSVLTPFQQIELLGLLLNTPSMSLTLPGHKIRTIRGEAAQLLR